MQSEFDVVPLNGYGVIDVSAHSSTCKGDDLYPSCLLHQNYRCYGGQNVIVSRCY